MRRSFLLLLVSFLPAAGQTLPGCGFHFGRPCHPFDSEFYADGTLFGCDRGLVVDTRNFWKTSDDICKSDTRDQIAKDTDWVRWALGQQMMNIGANEPINWHPHITAHNAYNNHADTYPFPNQYYSITSLLNFGIRSVDLDIHWYADELRVCHGDSQTDAGCSAGDRAYGYAIREIADWIDANPGEVVIVNFEDDTQAQTARKLSPLDKYFGAKAWQVHDSYSLLGGIDRYPTVAEMLAHGKQVLIVGNYQVGEYVFKVDTNGYHSTQSKNFKASDCTSDGTSIQMDPSNLAYWPTLYEGRSFFEASGDINNVMYEGDVRNAANCGIASVDLDFIGALDQPDPRYSRSGPDLRREALVWSWAENDMGAGGNYPLFNGATGRWNSTGSHDGVWAFACAEPRTGDPRSWTDKKGDRWYVTTATGSWNDGASACIHYGNQLKKTLEFASPRNAYQNQKLWAVVGRNRNVWVSNTIRPVPNPALYPAILDFIVGEKEPGADQTQTICIYGPENSTFAATLTTANGEPWLRADVLQGTLVDGKAQVRISIVSSRTSNYARGDYAGALSVTITLPLKKDQKTPDAQTNQAPVFLHVKLPSRTNVIFLSSQAGSLTFQGELVTDLLQEVRPTGTIELRSKTTDPATLRVNVRTLGSAQVNSHGDSGGTNLPDNMVQFPPVTLLPGNNAFTAVYLGDSGYEPGASTEFILHSPSAPIVSLSASPEGGAQYHNTFQLIARAVDPMDGLQVDGSVSFRYDQGAVLGTAVLIGGVATFTVGPLPPGHYTFSAASSNTNFFNSAASNTVRYTVLDPVRITLDSSPSGLYVMVDGVSVKTPYVASWIPNQKHVLSGGASFQQVGDYRYAYYAWRDSGTLTYTVAESPETLVAAFFTQVLLRLDAGAGGNVSVSNNLNNNWFSVGDSVFVYGTPNPGWAFLDFTGDLSSQQSPLVFNISKPTHLKAEFVQGIDITVRTNYPGLRFGVFGNSHTAPVTFKQIPGQTFQCVTAANQDAGDTRNRLDKWSPGATTPSFTYTVPNVATPIEIVAQFRRDHLLRMDVVGGGTIVTLPAAVDGYFADASTVQAVAIPKPGFVFTRWENAATGSSPFAGFAMTGPKSLRAVFDAAGTPAGAESVLAASVTGKSGDPKLRSWLVQFQQIAGKAAAATQITGIVFQAVSGSCTVAPQVLNPLPAAVGPFVGGKAAAGLAIDFSGCPAATRFTVTIKYGAAGGGAATIGNQFQ